ncbi:MAG: DUF134 domain-containing protein [Deltaproteobacteria bacterium]|nr:DUF134 domain-containing protein [Deltaproteobacteria bacterium]
MPRPKCCRRISGLVNSYIFKPTGPVDSSFKEEVVLTIDELEAIRLADLEDLYQEQAAEMMNISRQTFGRIVDAAHKKIAQALINGLPLRINGNEDAMGRNIHFVCHNCRYSWESVHGTVTPTACPACQSEIAHGPPGECGPRGGGWRRGGRGGHR